MLWSDDVPLQFDVAEVASLRAAHCCGGGAAEKHHTFSAVCRVDRVFALLSEQGRVQAARRGVQRFSGSKLYCTMLPCKYRRESFYDGFCSATRTTAAEAGLLLVSHCR